LPEQKHKAQINPGLYLSLDEKRGSRHHVSLYDRATQTRLAALQHYFLANGSADPAAAMARAVNVVGVTIKAQSTVMGYADCFGLLGAILVVSLASVALLKRGPSTAGGAH